MASENYRPPYRNYEANQAKIKRAYDDFTNETGESLPSYEELAKRTGLSVKSIYNHFKKMDFDYVCKRERVHTPAVLEALRKTAIETGKAKEVKLYNQMVEGYIEEKKETSNIVGDLDVNTNISGDLKITVAKKIVTSKEQLDKMQNATEAIKEQLTKSAGGELPAMIQNIDTAVFLTGKPQK